MYLLSAEIRRASPWRDVRIRLAIRCNSILIFDFLWLYLFPPPVAGVTIGKAQVIQADVPASNGVVHIINAVILPAPQLDIVGILTSDARFSTLAKAATVASLIPTLQSGNFF